MEVELEGAIGRGIEKALKTPVSGGKTIIEWAAIGMKAPRWISVKDRMPCENPWESEWVLVWFGEQSALRTEAPLPGKWNPIQRTWWVVGFGEKYAELNLKITHWMPLPEPPKEGENETD